MRSALIEVFFFALSHKVG